MWFTYYVGTKSDGTRRMFVYYHVLIKLIEKKWYILAQIDDLMDQLGGTKYFYQFGLKKWISPSANQRGHMEDIIQDKVGIVQVPGSPIWFLQFTCQSWKEH